MDLSKAYDIVYQERLLMTLEGYGAGPCLCRLLETFWGRQQVMPRKNGFHGSAFTTTRGTTQGGLLSPTLFNVVLENVIRAEVEAVVRHLRPHRAGRHTHRFIRGGVFKFFPGGT